MAVKAVHPYPRSTAELFAVLTDVQYLKKKYEAAGATDVEVLECEQDGGEIVVKTRRMVRTNPPGLIKKFLPSRTGVVETHSWEVTDSETKRGTVSMDIEGAPVKLQAAMTLNPTESGCENVIEFTTTVSLPLFSRKVAKFVESDTAASLEEEHRFTASYLESL